MKKIFVALLLFISASVFFGIPQTVEAQTLRSDMCKAVTIIPKLNKADIQSPLTADNSSQTFIYIDQADNNSLFYKNPAGDLTRVDIGHNYGNVTATVKVDTTVLSPFFPGGIPSDLQVNIITGDGSVSSGGCTDTSISSSNFGQTNDLSTPYWDYCQKGFLGHDTAHPYKVHLKLNSSDIICPGFQFQKGAKPQQFCSITMNRPQGYTTNDDVIVQSIDNIQALCNQKGLNYYDDFYATVSCNQDMVVNGAAATCGVGGTLADEYAGTGFASLGPPGTNGGYDCSVHSLSNFNLGKLSVGTYKIEVARVWHSLIDQLASFNHDKIYCSSTISVVLPNETLTPAVTGVTDQHTPEVVEFTKAEATDLCDELPQNTDAKCPNCRLKCATCQGNGGIWTAVGCLPTNASELVSRIFEIFSGMLGGVIFICIMWNGLKVMLSRGSPDALKKAQEAITSCVIGLLVLMFSILFLKVVGVDILKIPGWK